MTPEQQSALAGVAGRALTEAELIALEPLVAARNDVAVAALLSVGRKRLHHKPIGYGTILEAAGDQGGALIDALTSLGAENRNVYWGMKPVERGELDLGLLAVQAQLGQLAAILPQFADALHALQALGYAPDPIHFNTVSDALNVAEGRMTL